MKFDDAAKPLKPSNGYGSIRVIDNVSLSLINWESPQNRNETDIELYDITLLRNHSNGTNNSIRVAASSQTLSYKYSVLDGNYTAASIVAVDLCGQRSEASEFQLMPVAGGGNPDHDGQKSSTAGILAGVIVATIVTVIIINIALISSAIVIRHRYRRYVVHKQETSRSICSSCRVNMQDYQPSKT